MSILRVISVLLLIFVITTVLLSPVATAESGTSDSERGTLPLGTQTSEALTQTAATKSSNISNTSSRHIGPELIQETPSTGIVISELEARIGSQLLNSSEALQAGQFDRAETAISGNTTNLLRQYEELAASTESTTDDELAQDLNLTREQQLRLINVAQNSTTTYNEYQVARANGNQTRARELARTLLNQTAEANQTAEKLSAQYEKLGNESDLDTAQTLAAIDKAQGDIKEIQDTITSETPEATQTSPIQTSLRVSSSGVASPTQPLVVSGTLSSNSSYLPNKTIEVALGNQVARTKTNEAGEFSVSLRPVMTAAGQQTLSVQFTPEPTSRYDEDGVEESIQIESVSPTLIVESSPAQIQFGDTLVIEGIVTANQIPLADVPVTTTIAGQAFRSTRTDEQGAFDIRGSLPATIPNGSQRVDVIVSEQNTAVKQVTQTNKIQINRTETMISFASAQKNDSNVSFVGQLTTPDGNGLSNRRVSITHNNRSSVSVNTNQSGYFDGIISIDASNDLSLPFVSDQPTLTARYDAGSGNLESSTQTTMVSDSSATSVPLQWIGFSGITVVVVIYGLTVWRRRESQPNQSEDKVLEMVDSTTDLHSETVENASPSRIFAHAEQYHADGNMEAAAILSYAALRKKYIQMYDVTRSLTHWEVYQTLKPELNSSSHELLYEVTGIYERELYSNKKFDSTDNLDTILEKLADVIQTDNES